MHTTMHAVPDYEVVPSPDAPASAKKRFVSRSVVAVQVLLFLGSVVSFIMLYRSFAWSSAVTCINAAAILKHETPSSTSSVPQYFQTAPMLFAGQQNMYMIHSQVLF